MMVEVLIVGAGMAGLSAALELKRLGVPYLLLEAGAEPGGRAITRRLPSSVAADLGAHWLHGKHNPLKDLLEHYAIPYRRDKAKHLYIYQDGKARKSRGSEWLDKAVDWKKARRIERGEERDCPISMLAVDEKGREVLIAFALMWNGIDLPLEPSALEFLTEESTPGGLQPEGGVGALIEKMAQDAGYEHIRCSAPVLAISGSRDGVRAETSDGAEWKAEKAIVTASAGVLESGLIAFDPEVRAAIETHLSGLVVGKMNKIIIKLGPEFLHQRAIAEDMSLELLDANPPHFCHIRSGGLPLITLFVSGRQAESVEGISASEALDYVRTVLAPVKELRGFETRLVGEPVVTRWVGNPYTRSSYASCLPGARRSGPWMEQNICFCGDSFTERFPASLAGAFLSGQTAAHCVIKPGLAQS